MPRVPTYDNFTVEQANLPNVALRPPGARLDAPWSAEQASLPGRQMMRAGESLMRAGDAMSQVVADEVRQANQVRVNDALNQAAKVRLDLTFDPAQGFVNLRGENALKRPGDQSLADEYGEKLNSRLEEISKGLGNDAQRRAFALASRELQVQFHSSLTQHISKEYQNYQVGVHDGTIATGREQMSLAWGNPEAIKQARDAVASAVVEKGRLLGLPAKQIEAATVEALSPGHVAVIGMAVDQGQLAYAREYLKQNEKELTPQARLQITKLVETGDFEARTQESAGALWAKHKGDVGAALAEAREKFSGKDEDAIVTRLKTLDNEQRGIREARQRDAMDKVYGLYSQGKPVPASLLAEMDGKDLIAFRERQRADAEGRRQRTDVGAWLEFTNLPPEQMAQMNPQELMRRYGAKFSDADLRNADTMIRAVRAKGSGAPGELEGLQLVTVNDLMNRTARELGVLPEKGAPTKDQQAAFADFSDRIQVRVNEWEATNRKKASAEVVRSILNEEKLNKVRVDVWGSDPEKPIMSLTPSELERAYVVVKNPAGKAEQVPLAAVPAGYRADAVRRRRAAGLPVNEQAIVQMWVVDGRPKN